MSDYGDLWTENRHLRSKNKALEQRVERLRGEMKTILEMVCLPADCGDTVLLGLIGNHANQALKDTEADK